MLTIESNRANSADSRTGEGVRYVARQPILDLRGNLHAYELLFRAGPDTAFSGDGDVATRDVLDNTLVSGLERLTGKALAFINCTRESLLDRLVMVLPPQWTVLELLETLEPTPDLLGACRELKGAGYRIALDDFEWSPGWDPFLSVADYVKVDLSVTTPQGRAQLIRRLHGSPARLLAERVETAEELVMARDEGFTLFQGYYFCKPMLVTRREIPPNTFVYLNMLQALQKRPLETRQISNLVKRDAALTYRLLRMVNSPLYGVSKTITSIQEALIFIGDDMFRRIATLAVASEIAGTQPSELLRLLFVRGRFCERSTTLTGLDATEQYLLGILSLFPAVMGLSVDELVAAMPLRPSVRDALLGENNAERVALNLVECYEIGDWCRCDELLTRNGVSSASGAALYQEAMDWADDNFLSVF